MAARKSRRSGVRIGTPPYVFCCDSASLVDLHDAGLLRKARRLAQLGKMKIPEGVERELRRKTDKVSQAVDRWKKYEFVVDLDQRSLELLPEIERKYGPQFTVGGITYPGFWKSASGRKSADAQVVALAKSREWMLVSNDNSIHGACMLENVECRRWEEIGRLLLGPKQLDLGL